MPHGRNVSLQNDGLKLQRLLRKLGGEGRGKRVMTILILDKIRQVDNPIEAQSIERKKLIREIGRITICDLAVLYHNLNSPFSMLDDSDADMLEGVLSASLPKRPLLLLINSNGGLPLAAERIVHVARTFAPKGFRTMVVQKAKSAATMVCLGSDEIYMTMTAELGPIDPQIIGFDRSRRISVDSYLEAYDSLMGRLEALDMEKSNPAGLLHQLNRFDAAHVEEMRKARDLGRDMTTKFLCNWMLSGEEKAKVEAVVKKFSESAEHKSHGRPIWAREAKSLGLKINTLKHNSMLWNAAYELMLRYDHFCELQAMIEGSETTKMMETATTAHSASTSLSAIEE